MERKIHCRGAFLKVVSRLRDNDSVSEEAVWLAEDTRRVGSFSEVRRIRFGLDAGARMKSKMAEFAESNARKCWARSRIFRQRDWHSGSWKSGLRSSTILATAPGPPRRFESSRLVGSQ